MRFKTPKVLPWVIPATALWIPVFGLGFETAKVVVFIILVLVYIVLNGVALKVCSYIKILSLVFFLLLLVTSFLGINPQSSFFGVEGYYQGLITYFFLIIFSFLVSQSRIGLNEWGRYISLGCFAVSVVSIFQFLLLSVLGINIANYSGRVVSTFGQPNFYAGFLVTCLPFLIDSLREKKNLFSLLVFLFTIASIFISFSKGAILILAFLSIFYLLGFINEKSANLSKLALTVLIGIFLLLVFLTISRPFINLYYPGRVGGLIGLSSESRVLIWPVMVEIIKRDPVAGYGLENIDLAFGNFFQSVNFNTNSNPTYLTLKDMRVDRSHNYIMDLMLFGGVGTALIWIILCFSLVYKLRHNQTLLLSLVAVLMFSQIHNQSIVQLIMFWFLVGLSDKAELLTPDIN